VSINFTTTNSFLFHNYIDSKLSSFCELQLAEGSRIVDAA